MPFEFHGLITNPAQRRLQLITGVSTIDQDGQPFSHQLSPETTSLHLNLTKAGFGMLVIPAFQGAVHVRCLFQKSGFTLGA
jgi:hypothetical protein